MIIISRISKLQGAENDGKISFLESKQGIYRREAWSGTEDSKHAQRLVFESDEIRVRSQKVVDLTRRTGVLETFSNCS